MQNREFRAKEKRTSTRGQTFQKSFRMCDGDDLDAAMYEDDDLLDNPWWSTHGNGRPPSGERAYSARKRLERHLERMRLQAELADGFGDELDDYPARSRRVRRGARARRGAQPRA